MYLSVEFVVGYGKRSHTGNVLSCISSVEIFNLIKYMIWKVSLNECLPPEMNICQDDSPLNDVKKYLDIKLKLWVWKFKSMKNKITKNSHPFGSEILAVNCLCDTINFPSSWRALQATINTSNFRCSKTSHP